MWQAIYEELAPSGLEIVTVALDTDVVAARPSHEGANATHLSLVDPALTLVERFGMTNVPFGVWVDESGRMVRPPEVAYGPRSAERRAGGQAARAVLSDEQRETMRAMLRNTEQPDRYATAIRDWVAHDAASRYVLSPEEVIARSRPRPTEFGLAAAHFELGQHLHRRGHPLDAVGHFKEAHRLDPTNWSYIRDARSLVDGSWGDVYGGDLLSDVAAIGPETFYPPLDM